MPQSDAVIEEYGYDSNRNRTLIEFGEATDGDQSANTLGAVYDERDLMFRKTRGALTPPELHPNSPAGTAPTLLAGQ